MARYIFQGTFRDGQGNIIPSGTVTVYDAGTTTLSTIYTADSGGTAVTSIISDSNGFFYFYIDSSDYGTNTKFDIVLSKDGYTSKTYEDIIIYGQGPEGATGPTGATGPAGAKITSVAWSTNDMVFTLDDSSTVTLTNAKTDLTGPTGAPGFAPQTYNLSPRVNATVNILDILTKTGGAVPDDTNYFSIAIPDGTGYTDRIRNGSYLSGTSQITMADSASYWSKGGTSGEIVTCWLYAIYDGTGIVWALGGYSGFTRVPTTTTPTDDDYFLLENGSTYTRNAGHFCVSVARIRYLYLTSNSPNYTIQDATTIVNAPQIMWNAKSDYGRTVPLATTITSATTIADQSAVSVVVKQAGVYDITYQELVGHSGGSYCLSIFVIKVGSATYGSATTVGYGRCGELDAGATLLANNAFSGFIRVNRISLNEGDTIHGGSQVGGTTGNANLYGNNTFTNSTVLTFRRVD